MTSATQIIPVGQTTAPASESPRRSTFARLQSNAAGLSDQVLISGTNFVTMVCTARALRPDSPAFGEFSLVYAALLFTNIFQTSLITQPHNVLATTRRGESYRSYTTTSAAAQLLMSAGLALTALLVAMVALIGGWVIAPLLLALTPAIIAWQLQEFIRRVLYTEGRLNAAFVNDVLSYGGQAAVVIVLYVTQRLTGVSAFYALTVTSLIAVAFGAWQIRHSIARHLDMFVLAESWHFGKWLAGAEIVGWCSSLSAYMYIAAIIIGTQASGELKSAQILYGPARIFAYFLGTVLPIRFARTYSKGGGAALHRQFKAAARMILPLMAAYCLFVAVSGRWLLRLVFGEAFEGSGSLLVLYSISALLVFIQMFVIAALTSSKRTKYIFRGYVYGGVIAFCASWPIIYWLGVNGAILCMILTAVIVNGMCWLVYHRQIVRGETQAPDQIDDQSMLDHPEIAAEPIPGAEDILPNVLQVLDWKQVPYCLLHGYRDYPERITSDVDCLMPGWAARGGLPSLLHAHRDHIGASVVQYLADESPLLVLSKEADDGRAGWLPLHVTGAFKFNHLTFYRAKEILESRRKHEGMWVPAHRHEFAFVLINRVIKGSLHDKHARDLLELYSCDREGCRGEIGRFWPEADTNSIGRCIEDRNFDQLRSMLPRLRAELLLRRFIRQPLGFARSFVMQCVRRAGRFLRPSFGLHVVFLGPDGVGKSTVIDAVRQEIAPAFLGSSYQTFAPSILPKSIQPKKSRPHELPPRSLPASLLKAGWWLLCYTVGYLFSVHTVRGRAGVVLCHRYLLDAIVDPGRYRYSGPIWLLKAIRLATPQPDLVFLLDAPPEVIQQRKQEVPIEETARQRAAYRRLLVRQNNAHVIDASQPSAKVVSDVDDAIISFLHKRLVRRLELGGQA